MSVPRRVATLRAIAQAARARTASQVFVHIDQELQEFGEVNRVSPERRRHLLQLLHANRALETALKEIIRSYGTKPKDSLGSVLTQLTLIPFGKPGFLTATNAGRFKQTVRVARNRFAHEANAFPRSARETENILGEIEACFVLAVK
jgi:hypothetical protein